MTTSRLAAVLLVTIVLIAGSAAAANAADNGTWGVEPSGPPDTDVTGRGVFFFELAPGQTVTDWVSIQNHSSDPIAFYVFGADAFNMPDGAWALTEFGDPTDNVGSWLDAGSGAISVEGGKDHRIRFGITVPEDTPPGDYAGGIVALNQHVEGLIEGQTSVGIQRAVGARVYVRVTGPVHPALAIIDVSSRVADRFTPDGGDVVVEYEIKNVGNMRLAPQVVVSGEGLLADEYFRADPVSIPVLLPGESATLSHVWEDLPLLDLATVRVVANHDSVVASSSTDVVLISPLIVLGTLFVVLLVTYIVVRRRRRRSEQVTEAQVQQPAGSIA